MDKETIMRVREKLGYEDYHIVGPDKLREVYYGDYSNIIGIGINQCRITSSKQPLIGTYGLGPCIAIAGFDKKTKTAFLSHNVPIKKLEFLNDDLFDALTKMGTIEKDLEFYLVGGNEEYKEHAQKVEEYLKRRIKNPKIVYRDLIEKNDPRKMGKSIILDSINEKIYCHNGISIFGIK
jgi:chemotaxis receptor (MCP) glutamine deamidase CheD